MPHMFFSGSNITSGSAKLFCFLGFLINRATALLNNPYYFNHHGNNYRLSTDASKNSGNDQVAKEYFQAAGSLMESGDDCGNVTQVENPPTQWNISWEIPLKGCNRMLVLARDSMQSPHSVFEDCSKNSSLSLQPQFESQCKEEPNTSMVTKVLITIASVLIAIVGFVIAYRIITNKFGTRRGDYDNLEAPSMGQN